jgi:alkanesulfonate monooxygenase SsuD/methylene tetrahydromethanopterin reductase-like flavin-dependent oxidoreductase (luciferase family)
VKAVIARIHTIFPTTLVGSPDEVGSKIRAYAEVGVDGLVFKWFGLDDIEGLEIVAEHLLPHFAVSASKSKEAF